jgi:hypothetical protein
LTRWQRLLVPFRELCEQEEGRAQKLGEEGRYGTLWRVLHGMNFMSDVLEKAQDEVNGPQVDLEQTEHFNTGINTAWLKLEKYYKLLNRSPLYTAAIVLHPAWRMEYFEDKWEEHPEWIRTAKKTFKNLFLKYSANNASGDTAVEPAQSTESRSSEPKSSYLAYGGFSAEYPSRRSQRQRQKDVESLELDNYLKSFNHQLVVHSPLDWWKERRTEFPSLARMAFYLFSIPAMRSEVERVFSSSMIA